MHCNHIIGNFLSLKFKFYLLLLIIIIIILLLLLLFIYNETQYAIKMSMFNCRLVNKHIKSDTNVRIAQSLICLTNTESVRDADGVETLQSDGQSLEEVVDSLMSSVLAVMRRPSADKNSAALLPSGPCDSMATGTKSYRAERSMYLASLRVAADSAALPASAAVNGRYDAAVVSATVTSQMRQRPSRHGIKVRPSGRLPSVRERPFGSLVAGIPARVSER
jgi:hypothetical protein